MYTCLLTTTCICLQNQELQELQALSGKAASSRQDGSHSNRVVDNLRVQLNSTTSNFKSVLEVRRDALQASQARRNLFASSVAPAGVHHSQVPEQLGAWWL